MEEGGQRWVLGEEEARVVEAVEEWECVCGGGDEALGDGRGGIGACCGQGFAGF